jgi:deoxycytidine triphosphate deaminase
MRVANILADKDIRRLISTVLLNADEKLINPNGIELRLGKDVLFHSTGEEAQLGPGQFLKVNPGESVVISSLELIDFKPDTVHRVFSRSMLMGFITPTTTMMREGISQVATKIDAGFRGNLNWGLRNGSTRDLILQYGEPIFKLTIFELAENESPEIPYGNRPNDSYQDTEGIRRSTRSIPVDIPKSKLVSSSFDRLDPKKQLREAGYPFDHIGTELTNLHGKFEVVSADVRMMRDEFQSRTTELSNKIQTETATLAGQLEEQRKSILEKVEFLFDRKFLRVAGIIVGAIPIMYGGVTFLQGTGLAGNTVSFIAVVVGIVVVLGTYALTRSAR